MHNILFLESESLFHYPSYGMVFIVMKLPVVQKFYQNVPYNSSPCVNSVTVSWDLLNSVKEVKLFGDPNSEAVVFAGILWSIILQNSTEIRWSQSGWVPPQCKYLPPQESLWKFKWAQFGIQQVLFHRRPMRYVFTIELKEAS